MKMQPHTWYLKYTFFHTQKQIGDFHPRPNNQQSNTNDVQERVREDVNNVREREEINNAQEREDRPVMCERETKQCQCK